MFGKLSEGEKKGIILISHTDAINKLKISNIQIENEKKGSSQILLTEKIQIPYFRE